MGLIERLKTAGEQASSQARQSVREAQLGSELARAYDQLGRAAFALIERGALSDARLARAANRVRALQAERDLAQNEPDTPVQGDRR